MEELKPALPLLELPDLVIANVARCLGDKDMQSFATCNRKLSNIVSAIPKSVRLTSTPETRWGDLCKIFDKGCITCKTVDISGVMTLHEQPARDNALDMLLKSEGVSRYLFKGTTKVVLNVHPLPCIIPPNLARMLPDLEELHFKGYHNQYANLMPIPYCSSLSKLTFEDVDTLYTAKLPGQFRSAEDLRRQLPNSTSLELIIRPDIERQYPACVDTLIQAWCQQLTSLVYDVNIKPATVQQCTRLQSLSLNNWDYNPLLVQQCTQLQSLALNNLEYEPLSYLTSFTSLTQLQVRFPIPESDLESVLHLPLLRVLEVGGFSNRLWNDLSNHHCTLQQLTIGHARMVDLRKLHLRSLKGEGCLQIDTLTLPNPLHPDSLGDVLYAAKCVRNAGLIVQSKMWVWDGEASSPAWYDIDAGTAKLLQAASRVVNNTSHHIELVYGNHLPRYPKTIQAMIRWAAMLLESVDVYESTLASSWFWQTLQDCSNLEKVTFHVDRSLCQCVDDIRMQMRLSVELFVAPNRKRIQHVYRFSTHPSTEEKALAIEQIQRCSQEQLPSSVCMQQCSWESTTRSSDLHMYLIPSS